MYISTQSSAHTPWLDSVYHNVEKILGKISSDGLFTVKHTDAAGSSYEAISVPPSFFPGFVHAVQLKLNHPTESQMQRLMKKYSECPGHSRIIEEVFLTQQLKILYLDPTFLQT